MRRLTQKELVQEGAGAFMKKAAKGAMSVGGSILGGLAKTAMPMTAGYVKGGKDFFSNTARKAKAAMSTPEERIADYFKDMGYKVIGISPSITDDIKLVKVSEVEYTDDGSVKEVPVSSPFVIKIDKSGIKELRGPYGKGKPRDKSKKA